ncbi:MAG: 3-isopropylmalate dehydratase small subunit [Candidatus Dormibacteria bacterium]
MRPFVTESGVAIPLPLANVDTDQVIPKQFLKRVERTGFGPALFYDWRYDDAGAEKPGFVLNRAPFRSGGVLVAGRNFGCGSSREHAVWALLDFGIRAVIAPSFADIFRNNAAKAGLLPIILPEAVVDALASAAEEEPGLMVAVDLAARTVTSPAGTWTFEIDPFVQRCLLEGLDDIGLSLEFEPEITAFEASRPRWLPTLARV